MTWEIEYTDQFEAVWNTLTDNEQDALTERVTLLQEQGPGLGRPYADQIKSSRHANMKALRATVGAAHLGILYAFDPSRTGLLLILGDKSPNDSTSPNWAEWYDAMVPVADQLFTEHLNTL
jgi:hypothetical protein